MMYFLDDLATEIASLGANYDDVRDILDYLLDEGFLDTDAIATAFDVSADNDNDNDD